MFLNEITDIRTMKTMDCVWVGRIQWSIFEKNVRVCGVNGFTRCELVWVKLKCSRIYSILVLSMPNRKWFHAFYISASANFGYVIASYISDALDAFCQKVNFSPKNCLVP